MTDYTILFQDADVLDSAIFRCCYYRDGGKVTFSHKTSHSLVFVLKGSLTASEFMTCTLPEGYLMAISQKRLRQCTCEPGTIILEYITSPRFEAYLNKCSETFDLPFSQVIPILPSLCEWIDRELTTPRSDSLSADEICVQRKSFATVMVAYPPKLLEELYICFFACARGHCKHCNQNDPFALKELPKAVGALAD